LLFGEPALLVDVAVLLLLVFLVVRYWVRPEVDWPRLSDGVNHLVRVFVVSTALQVGDWFPRWVPDLYLGYGYPLLNFYAPATYYLTTLFIRLGTTVYGALQWTGVIGVLAGATGAYCLGRGLYNGRRDAGLMVGATYVLAPYPFLHNLYSRAAIPELLALGLMPWLILTVHGAVLRGGRWVWALSVLVGLLLLTHNISSLIGLTLIAAWTVVFTLVTHREDLRIVEPQAGASRVAAAVLAGMGLSAFFWIPALTETSAVQLELGQRGILDFRTWVYDPVPIAVENWQSGRYASLGPVSVVMTFVATVVGKSVPGNQNGWQVGLWLAATLVCAWRWRQAVIPLFWSAVAAVCWFFHTTWSLPLWEHLPLLPLLQFPSRLDGILSLALAIAAAGALTVLPRPVVVHWPARVVLIGLTVAAGYTAIAERPLLLRAAPARAVDAHYVAGREDNWFDSGTTSSGEFLPRTVHWPAYPSGRKEGLRIFDLAYPEASWQAGMVRVVEGRGSATAVYRGPRRIAADITADTSIRVGFHQIFFPGWRAFVDGKRASVKAMERVVTGPPPEGESIYASLGFMAIDVPAGKHRVEVVFGPTLARQVGTGVSAATVALAAVLALLAGVRRGNVPFLSRRLTQRSLLPQIHRLPLVAVGVTSALVGGIVALLAQEIGARPAASFSPAESRVVVDIAESISTNSSGTAAPSSQRPPPVQVRTPAGVTNGTALPFVNVNYAHIAGDERRWLYMHPPSEVAVQLRVPADAYFQAGLGLAPEIWHADTGDGVRFVLLAETATGSVTLLDRHVNPRAAPADRRWLDTWVSLEAVAGQDVRLILRTDPVGDMSYDWAGWANPQVVVWHGGRPHPGSALPW
jgi:hypothetical protein